MQIRTLVQLLFVVWVIVVVFACGTQTGDLLGSPGHSLQNVSGENDEIFQPLIPEGSGDPLSLPPDEVDPPHPCAINMIAPSRDSVVSGTLFLAAKVSNDDPLIRVEFYRDGGILLGQSSDQKSPYTLKVNALPLGPHVIEAVVFGPACDPARSRPVNMSQELIERLPNGNMLIQFVGVPGHSYVVQATTDFVIWQDLATLVADWGGFFFYEDFETALYPFRFYRAVPGPNSAPVADAGSDQTGFVGMGMQFSGAASTDADGTLVNFEWDFNDGTPRKTGTDAEHTYAAPGVYQVTLTVTDDRGSVGSDSTTVTISAPAAGQVISAARFGGAGSDYGRAVSVDQSGNVFVGGSVNSLPSLIKYSSAGRFLWSFTSAILETGLERGTIRGIATDSDDNVYITGEFSETLDFGGGPLTSSGGYDIFLVKLSASGVHLWSKRFGSSVSRDIPTESGLGIAIAGNRLAITGIFDGAISFGGALLTTTSGQDLFLAEFSTAAGTHLWSKRVGGAGATSGSAVAFDGDENVFVTGRFGQTVNFGSGPVTALGGLDMFIAQYDSQGALLWVNHYGNRMSAATVSGGTALAVDASGDVVVTGMFKFTMSFGGSLLTSAGYEDIFVAKYSGTHGAYLWSKRFGNYNSDVATGIATDGQGNVSVATWGTTAMDFGGGPILVENGVNVFLANFTSGGVHRWSKGFEVGSGSSGPLATNSFGHLFTVGHFGPFATFEGRILHSSGGSDIFITEVAP